MIALRRCRIVSLFFVTAALASVATQAGESRQMALLRTRHESLRRDYAESLNGLARDLSAVGAADAAAEASKLAVPPDPRQIVLQKLPKAFAQDPSLDLPAGERELRLKFRTARRDQSIELYRLSRQALTAGSVRYAYELLRESAAQDPDNPTARKVLGYVPAGKEWLTPYTAKKKARGDQWHATYGWLPKDHVARYEAGERFSGGRWITAEQDAELRRDFLNAWEVETEHYLVKTNHSLERGVEIATRLEEFHDFFVNAFAGFFNSPQQLKVLFQGSGTARPAEQPKHEVHYFRTRDEYNRRLVSKEAKIGDTNGLYFTTDRVAYFYHDEGRTADDTLYHEATHQLLYESLPKQREVGTQAHFWVIEGFACYMESFRPGAGGASLGDPGHVRIQAARYRYLDDGHYTPLGKFAAMGLHEFQTVPLSEMMRNYSQAAGLAHFFMHYDRGRYRDALIEHLAQLYHGAGPLRRPAQNLAELTGVAYTELDRQYGAYVKGLGEVRAAARER